MNFFVLLQKNSENIIFYFLMKKIQETLLIITIILKRFGKTQTQYKAHTKRLIVPPGKNLAYTLRDK